MGFLSSTPITSIQKKGAFFARWAAFALFTFSLILTLVGWRLAVDFDRTERRLVFERECRRVTSALLQRLLLQTNILWGARAVFTAPGPITPAEWRRYTRSMDWAQDFPEIVDVGYAGWSRAGGRESATVLYNGAAERARSFLGDNLWAVPALSGALARARDSGRVTLGRKQDNGTVSAFLAVYGASGRLHTVEERRRALRGYVYLSMDVDRFVENAAGRRNPWLTFDLFDGATTALPRRLYGDPTDQTLNPGMELIKTLTVGERAWTVAFTSRHRPSLGWTGRRATWILLGGTAVSLLLFLTLWVFSSTRQRAIQLADNMTRELRGAERFLDSILEEMPLMVFVKESESLKFVHFNRAGEELIGVSRWDMLGRNDHDFFPREQADEFIRKDRLVLTSGKPVDIPEEPIQTRDKGLRILRTRKIPLLDETGSPRHLLGISEDITERKLADEALRKAKDEAEAASRAKSDFLANMSHELRTPLNSVIGFANMLLKNKGGNLSPDDLLRLERIRDNGLHLLTLINEILDLSRVEARRMPLHVSEVAVDILVLETLAQIDGLPSEKKNVRLSADLPPQLEPIVTDAGKLKQVLINLVANALKFTEAGSVTVRVTARPGTHRPGVLEVTDTGIGIPESQQALIFEAFQQAESQTSRRYGGTGLGLTICKAFLELMGHRIQVESRVGRGTTFRIVFGDAPPTDALIASGAEREERA